MSIRHDGLRLALTHGQLSRRRALMIVVIEQDVDSQELHARASLAISAKRPCVDGRTPPEHEHAADIEIGPNNTLGGCLDGVHRAAIDHADFPRFRKA